MRGLSSAARDVAKRHQLFRSKVFESWIIIMQGVLQGLADSVTKKTLLVLTSKKRQSFVNAVVKANGSRWRTLALCLHSIVMAPEF